MKSVEIRGRQFGLRWHAIARYQERVRPDLDMAEAEADLRALLADADIDLASPAWARKLALAGGYPTEWVSLEKQQLLFPVVEGFIQTTLFPESIGATIRIRGT